MAEYLDSSQPGAAGSGPASARYGSLQIIRENFLIRARRQSRLTIPGICREWGENQTTTETIPWQTLGGYGVNNLSAKLVMAMFPPGIPYINLKPTKKVLQSFAAMPDDQRGQLKDATDKALSGVEMEYIDGCEEDGDRSKHFDAMRHLLITGNGCLKMREDQKAEFIPLEQYVTRRDGGGKLLEAVIQCPMEWESLPEDIQELCIDAGLPPATPAPGNQGGMSNQFYPATGVPINVFTHIKLVGGKYNIYQECWGVEVPGSRFTYDEEVMPYLFLRLVALKGEDYGRSYCEDYEGDLQTYDGFWQILTEGSAAMAQLKWLVKPGGVTNKKQFAESANGAVLTGDPEDVMAVRSEHQADLQVAFDTAEKVEQRLEKCFLLFTQREGERVTATEIQKVIQDLQEGLGGIYSNLVVSYQAPWARLKLNALQKAGRVTKLPKGTVKVTILTGDAALGRQQKAQTLDEFLQTSVAVFGPAGAAAIMPYISIDSYLSRGAANRGIDSDGLIKSEEEVDAKQQAQVQQEQQATMAQNVAPEVVKQGGQMISDAGGLGAVQQASQAANAPPPSAPAPAAQPSATIQQ